MNVLVKIETRYMQDGNESNTVNARELHGNLGVGKDFSTWIKNQIVRARLLEGQDFIKVTEKGERKSGVRGASIKKEYYLTLDAAKHIAMVSRAQKGFEIRQYFIEFEKAYSLPPNFQIPQTRAEALRLAADLEEKIALDAPNVEYAEAVMESEGSMSLTKTAKSLEVGLPHSAVSSHLG